MLIHWNQCTTPGWVVLCLQQECVHVPEGRYRKGKDVKIISYCGWSIPACAVSGICVVSITPGVFDTSASTTGVSDQKYMT